MVLVQSWPCPLGRRWGWNRVCKIQCAHFQKTENPGSLSQADLRNLGVCILSFTFKASITSKTPLLYSNTHQDYNQDRGHGQPHSGQELSPPESRGDPGATHDCRVPSAVSPVQCEQQFLTCPVERQHGACVGVWIGGTSTWLVKHGVGVEMIRTAFSVVAQVVEAKEEGGPQAGMVLMGILGTTRYLL